MCHYSHGITTGMHALVLPHTTVWGRTSVLDASSRTSLSATQFPTWVVQLMRRWGWLLLWEDGKTTVQLITIVDAAQSVARTEQVAGELLDECMPIGVWELMRLWCPSSYIDNCVPRSGQLYFCYVGLHVLAVGLSGSPVRLSSWEVYNSCRVWRDISSRHGVIHTAKMPHTTI